VLGDETAPCLGRGELAARRHKSQLAIEGDDDTDAGDRSIDGGEDRLADGQQIAAALLEAARPSSGAPSIQRVVWPAAAASRGMSAPAQKPRPAPVRTMARTSSLASASIMASRNWRAVTAVKALRLSARLSVMVATPSATAYSTSCAPSSMHALPSVSWLSIRAAAAAALPPSPRSWCQPLVAPAPILHTPPR
jgi:hypothetical protein